MANLRSALYTNLTNLRDSSVETQSIVVLDFGAQYSQLIARRIRENKVFSVVLPFSASLEEIRSYSPVGIILSGGPSSVYDKDAPHSDRKVLELGVPVLGICYGLQFMVYALGGKVRPAEKREYGHATVERVAESRLFGRCPESSLGLDVARRLGRRTSARILSHGKDGQMLSQQWKMLNKRCGQCSSIQRCIIRRWVLTSCVILR